MPPVRNREMQRNVIASVVASVLFIAFVQPVLRGMWLILVWLSANVWTGLLNGIYRSAALGQRNWIDVIVLSLLVLVLLLIFVTVLVLLWKFINLVRRLDPESGTKSEDESDTD